MLDAITRLRMANSAAPGVIVYPGMAEDLRRVLDLAEPHARRIADADRYAVTPEERNYIISNAALNKEGIFHE